MTDVRHDNNELRDWVKAHVPILDVAQGLECLHSTNWGKRVLALCPFHDDKRIGSFVINPKTGTFKCYSCNAQGDAITLYRGIHPGLTYRQALEEMSRGRGPATTGVAPKAKREEKPLLDLGMDLPKLCCKTGDQACTLIKALLSWPWTEEQRERLLRAFEEYLVGSCLKENNAGWAIFWQIDDKWRVLGGKMMRYRPDGHRDRESRYRVDSAVSILSRMRQLNPGDARMGSCLFGLHRVDKYPDAKVVIVESEKTALLCTAFDGSGKRIYMATGGKSALSESLLRPLMQRGRDVTLSPDADACEAWLAVAKGINYARLSMLPPVRRREGTGEKADLGDFIETFVRKAS